MCLSSLVKRSFSLAGHRTSVALEAEFWAVLLRMAQARGQSLSALVAVVDATRGPDRPLASALPQLSGLPSWARAMGVLKHHGFSPATVFDIGVAYGTFPLYRAFPDAFYHLIDPARESLAHMRRLSRRLRCELHAVALGDHDGEAALEVRADFQESTLLEEMGPRRVRRVDRVPLRRFDLLFGGPIARPALCKIDVQGAELMVLAPAV